VPSRALADATHARTNAEQVLSDAARASAAAACGLAGVVASVVGFRLFSDADERTACSVGTLRTTQRTSARFDLLRRLDLGSCYRTPWQERHRAGTAGARTEVGHRLHDGLLP
jgi:hypothetical protein